MRHTDNNRRARTGLWPVLGAGALILALGACDTESLVQLEDPDLITSGTVLDTANISSVRNGVLFEFSRAVTGPAGNNQTPGVVGLGGLLADELWYASTFPTMKEIDSRSITSENREIERVFQYLQRARNLAERATELYDAGSRKGSADHAMVTNVAGYSYLFLAENFCSGIPFSQTALGGGLTFGAPKTTEEVLNLAIQRFDAAIAIAQGSGATQQLNAARVGKARALQDLGRFAEAAQVASQVPNAGFEFQAEYSSSASGQNNGVWQNVNSERRSSAASNEGVNGLRFFNRGASGTNNIDPRVSVDSAGTGIGTQVVHYRQLKYPERGSDVTVASSVEARLIVAENLLNRGASAAYLPILNELRAGAKLAPLTDPGTPAARVRQLYEERAFWLWLTGHRLGDLRRLVRIYKFQPNEVFPIGRTIFGDSYGNDVNFPVPLIESNNPEAAGGKCLNRDA